MADDEDEVVMEEEVPQPAGEEGDSPAAAVEVKPIDPPKYEVRPGLGEKFQAQAVKEIIITSMQEQLMGRPYRGDQAPRWSKMIANGVRQRVQELGMKRYKIVVQTTIFETRGAGIKSGQRCVWDPETDAYVDELYRSDTLAAHTTVYGVYMY